MKNIAKLLVFGLLMQHGVANASWKRWISNELLGRKQARIVHGIKKYQEEVDQEFELKKAQYIGSIYNTACWDAVYLEERRDFIRHFGTLGLDCLRFPTSEVEEKYKDVKANFYTKKCNFVVDTNICHDAILQFDLEQRVYQNRIVATILLGVASIAGYVWANKK